MYKSLAAGLLGLSLTTVAHAQEKIFNGYVDLFAIPYSFTEGQDITGADAEDDGYGLGLRSIALVTDWLAFSGEYQTVELDATDDSIDQLRAGLGYIGRYGGVFVEYTDFDTLGVSNDGIGIHLRTSYNASRDMNFYGDIGYLILSNDFQDVDGLEATLGLDFRLTDRWVIFADLRYTHLKGDTDDAKIAPLDTRLGVRIPLGY